MGKERREMNGEGGFIGVVSRLKETVRLARKLALNLVAVIPNMRATF